MRCFCRFFPSPLLVHVGADQGRRPIPKNAPPTHHSYGCTPPLLGVHFERLAGQPRAIRANPIKQTGEVNSSNVTLAVTVGEKTGQEKLHKKIPSINSFLGMGYHVL